MNQSKSWTDKQISQHKTASELLCKIMGQTFDFIRQNLSVTEYGVQQFIQSKYKQYDMIEDVDPPIVAFRENTSFVHYFPEEKAAKKLEPNSLIMIDIWARINELDAPFADITWMAWHGDDVPTEIQKGFDVVLRSRDRGLEFIREKLLEKEPIQNNDLGKVMEDVTMESDLQEFVPHAYGHSLGTNSCHGKLGVIHSKSDTLLLRKVGYTDEPGIYVKGKYGFRSEIDFYVDDNDKLVITTHVQTGLERV